jgi:hypothetical protein
MAKSKKLPPDPRQYASQEKVAEAAQRRLDRVLARKGRPSDLARR